MMHARRLVRLLPLLSAVACGRATPSTPAAEPAAVGERSPYERACAPCHGVDARGDGPAAGALVKPPPDLSLLTVRNGGVFPRDVVVGVVTGERPVAAHGTREMPVWSIRFDPPSLPAAVASVVTQRRIEAIVRDLEARQRAQP